MSLGWVSHAKDDVSGEWVSEGTDSPVYVGIMSGDTSNNFYITLQVRGGNEKFGTLYKTDSGDWVAGLFLTTYVAVPQDVGGV